MADKHRYTAQVRWSRGDARFVDNRYARRHEWRFDGGVTVAASSSPSVVPVPLSAADAVDPEEALVASASSCHMLWFLSLAARRGFVVDRYEDDAAGTLAPDAGGKLAFDRVVLKPRIAFSGERTPSDEELRAIHHEAHENCFIARSLKCEVVVE